MNVEPLWIDEETFGNVDLKTVGAYKYWESAHVQLIGYAVGDAPAEVYDMTAGARMPYQLARPLNDPSVPVIAHNAQFDRLGLPGVARHRWRCTMAQAMAHSLPGGLNELCAVLQVAEDKAKLAEGHALVMLFCKPNKDGTVNDRTTHPAEWERYKEYCRLDVEAMRACSRIMPHWNYDVDADLAPDFGSRAVAARELNLWHVDQLINDRGLAVDLDLARHAYDLARSVKESSDAEATDLTSGAVTSMGQRDKLLAHILGVYGVDLPDMRATTLEKRMADEELPGPVRELIGLRLASTKASVAKYRRILKSVSQDGRIHGMLAYCGAMRTGRWAGRIVQVHNLPRPTMPQAEIDFGIKAIKSGAGKLVLSRPLATASAALRGVFIAKPGHKLVVADLSMIEGRCMAWLAGCTWKIQAYKDFDAGIGQDTYILAYSRAFHAAIHTITKAQRQIGKVCELALQFQGAVGAFVSMAKTLGVVISDEEALAVVKAWRATNKEIVDFWYSLQGAALAVLRGQRSVEVGRVTVDQRGTWLRVRLPSGRYLSYPGAAQVRNAHGLVPSYLGRNTYTHQWGRIDTYGGKIAENVTQAVARDVFAEAIPRAEAVDFSLVMHGHDELVAEVPIGGPGVDELCKIITAGSDWTEGLPLAAAGFECQNYRKEQ